MSNAFVKSLMILLILCLGIERTSAQDLRQGDIPALTFEGFGTSNSVAEIAALSFTGLQSSNDASNIEPLTFRGLSRSNDAMIPPLFFAGLGTPMLVETSASLVFHGWSVVDVATPEPAIEFQGIGIHDVATPTLALDFSGIGIATSVAASDRLLFEGWGVASTALPHNRIRHQGFGSLDPLVISEDFADGMDGWTTSNGPGATFIDKAGALCLIDSEPDILTLYMPPRFLGDWGGGDLSGGYLAVSDGSFAFRAYYDRTTQWPIVVTLNSPAGTAVFRASLSSYNDAPFQDIFRPLTDIWWEEDGDWDAIIRNITRVSIVVDIKDGYSGATEICVDDFVLTLAPKH
jgi:hypothetical protein